MHDVSIRWSNIKLASVPVGFAWLSRCYQKVTRAHWFR
jgi:hypothetical protein